MDCPDTDLLCYELEHSAECILHTEREIKLLGWLPTSATSATLERLGRERAHHAWLLQRLWRPEELAQTCLSRSDRGPGIRR